MRTELDVLLDRVADPALQADLRAHVRRLQARRTYGLVFESHLPERVRLPDLPIRVGGEVVHRGDRSSPTYEVLAVAGDELTVRQVRHPDGSFLTDDEQADVDDELLARAEAVVIADFRDPIHPGLRFVGSVDRGGDKPHHVAIKGENLHVLEALQFTHAGKVDCIYIDPPYNTGNTPDWKYDNNYVDGADEYRHSKWLAFMERRLSLASRLLNPQRSVLIVAINYAEVLRLGLLLEQVFPVANIQLVTVVTNPSGSGGVGFNRVDENLFFVCLGNAQPAGWVDNLLTDDAPSGRVRGGLSWESFLRSGRSWYRTSRANLCYPILVDPATARILGTGPPFAGEDEQLRPIEQGGLQLAWPVRNDGRLGIWRTEPKTLMELVDKGYAYVSRPDAKRGTWAVKYLLEGTIAMIESGKTPVTRTGDQGQVVAAVASTIDRVAKTVWFRPAHNAGKHGSDLVQALIPGRSFPFPKSLYAVEDAVRFFVAENEDAVVLDFFAGTGTTAHAVARLNRQDGGRRQAIVVTNNEVSAVEAAELSKQGLFPGDPEWEAHGIFEDITRPRIEAAITGRTPAGEPVRGAYRFTDEFEMSEGFEESATFLELQYLDADEVELGRSFASIAPLLWLKAGGCGPMISSDSSPFEWTERYGVLFDTDRWRAFVSAAPRSAVLAGIVTESAATFAAIAGELPVEIGKVQLYEQYLATFDKLRIGG